MPRSPRLRRNAQSGISTILIELIRFIGIQVEICAADAIYRDGDGAHIGMIVHVEPVMRSQHGV